MGDLERSWKVGELAPATGLTIRALHHYDEIGLLVPARTESGHRLYAAEDVERLYRILALRALGMALDEIAAVLDDDGVGLIDTVRRHVAAVERDIEQRRRLLARLREMLDTLDRAASPSVDELIGTVEAMTVVEATVEEVVTREPWQALWEQQAPIVVLLRETGGERVLPIWIGQPEAAALIMHRRGMKTPRPMSPDLTVALLDAAGARVERVVIERLESNTFFATVCVVGAEPREVDARPSDALNIALRSGAPVHVATDVIDASGLAAWPGEAEASAGSPDQPPPWVPLHEAVDRRGAPGYVVDDDSPRVLRLAAEQARELSHELVTVPHLLLGLLADQATPAPALLARHGVTLPAARAATQASAMPAQRPAAEGAPLPLGGGAVFTMQMASVHARKRGGAGVGPLHLLAALVDSPDAHALPALADADLDALRAGVRAALDQD